MAANIFACGWIGPERGGEVGKTWIIDGSCGFGIPVFGEDEKVES